MRFSLGGPAINQVLNTNTFSTPQDRPRGANAERKRPAFVHISKDPLSPGSPAGSKFYPQLRTAPSKEHEKISNIMLDTWVSPTTNKSFPERIVPESKRFSSIHEPSQNALQRLRNQLGHVLPAMVTLQHEETFHQRVGVAVVAIVQDIESQYPLCLLPLRCGGFCD